jgi:hypothetical protein
VITIQLSQINLDNDHEYIFLTFHWFASFCAREPPPFHLFCSQGEKIDKVDGPEAGNSEWIKQEFLMDPEKPA